MFQVEEMKVKTQGQSLGVWSWGVGSEHSWLASRTRVRGSEKS